MFVGPRYRTLHATFVALRILRWRLHFWTISVSLVQHFTVTTTKTFLIHKQADSAAIAAIPVRRESRSMRLNQKQCTKMIGSVLALAIEGADYYRRFGLLNCLAEKRHSLSCNLTGVQIGRQICYIERHSPTDAVVTFLKARRKSNCAEEGSGYTYNQLLYVYTRQNS
jgi:hypothetical protein